MNLIKKVVQISVVIFTISCNNNEKLVEHKLITQDNKYQISLKIPQDFDTNFVWTDASDNLCSHTKKYRFTNIKFPIHKESGFGHLEAEDSLYRLTIKHVDNFICKGVLNGEKATSLQKINERLKLRGTIDSIEINKIEKKEINGREFIISQYKLKRKWDVPYWNYVTKALTVVDSNFICFEFEIKKEKHISNEFEIMDKVINSMVIK